MINSGWVVYITRFSKVFVWTFGSHYRSDWEGGELVLQLKYMLEHVVISVTIKLAVPRDMVAC